MWRTNFTARCVNVTKKDLLPQVSPLLDVSLLSFLLPGTAASRMVSARPDDLVIFRIDGFIGHPTDFLVPACLLQHLIFCCEGP